MAYFLAKYREDGKRRIEARIHAIDRQLEEFYGPLNTLVLQLFNVNNVKKVVLTTVPAKQRDEVEFFLWGEFFSPLHTDIHHLIRTRGYLLEAKPSDEFAKALRAYLEHSVQELAKVRLGAHDPAFDTSDLTVPRWPRKLYPELESVIKKRVAERSRLLGELQSRRRRRSQQAKATIGQAEGPGRHPWGLIASHRKGRTKR